jgi:hypothetical protein
VESVPGECVGHTDSSGPQPLRVGHIDVRHTEVFSAIFELKGLERHTASSTPKISKTIVFLAFPGGCKGPLDAARRYVLAEEIARARAAVSAIPKKRIHYPGEMFLTLRRSQ